MGLVDGSPMLLVRDVTIPYQLTLDAANVYWSDGTQLMRAPRKLPLVGETITTSPGYPKQLTIHRGDLFWISPSDSNEPAALLATSGGIASVTDQVTLRYSIAVDDDFVYWTEFEPGRIMRVARGAANQRSSPTARAAQRTSCCTKVPPTGPTTRLATSSLCISSS